MMSIDLNYKNVLKEIPEHVTLVAVSKTKPVEDIQALYDLGQRDFGENKVQEMCEKAEVLPKDIRWHMIGHVQENKIKYMADFVYLIHGIDKAKRLKEVQKQAKKNNRIIEVLLQIHIAEEDTKFGMDIHEARQTLASGQVEAYPNVKIVGLMGMATFTNNKEQIKREFHQLNALFQELKNDFPQLQHLSMGMSGDFDIAIAEGSNMVRVGSAIFGARNYG